MAVFDPSIYGCHKIARRDSFQRDQCIYTQESTGVILPFSQCISQKSSVTRGSHDFGILPNLHNPSSHMNISRGISFLFFSRNLRYNLSSYFFSSFSIFYSNIGLFFHSYYGLNFPQFSILIGRSSITCVPPPSPHSG